MPCCSECSVRLRSFATANGRPLTWPPTSASGLLVVQRTGWGKSVVYFLAAKILRDAGAGPTLLISPLLSLMRNQILAAEKLGIRAATIHSQNLEDWAQVEAALQANQVDVLMVSPERLGNAAFLQKAAAADPGQHRHVRRG